MSDTPLPEPDRIPGAPHPRETRKLFGQNRAEQAFLQASASGRLHHGWLITGPRGVGKATLAWKIARYLLSEPGDAHGMFGALPASAPTSLDTPADTPLAHHLAALSEPRLFLLRRPTNPETGKLRQQITVDEARKLKGFFALSAADGGRRVVIVDSADEMNPSAANALLKLLEEPPEGAVLLLISHQPARLLPTIRSRCRELRCHPLPPQDMARALAQAQAPVAGDATALAALAGGSVGEALRLTNLAGLEAYRDILALAASLPQLDRARALALAESAAGRDAGPRFDLLLHLIDLFLSRLARAGVAGPPMIAAGPNEAVILARLAPGVQAARHWATLQQELSARAAHGRAVNLDPGALILDMMLKIEHTAVRVAAP